MDVLANIVVQILRNHKALLRHRELRDLGPGMLQTWRNEWKKDEADTMLGYLKKVFAFAGDQLPLLLMIDRLDTCRDFVDSCGSILRVLENLVHDSANVKIIITALVLQQDLKQECEEFLRRDIVEGDVGLRSKTSISAYPSLR